jgi:hypothetical protein
MRLRRSRLASGPVPDKWADAVVQKLIYGVDVMQVADDIFEEELAKM